MNSLKQQTGKLATSFWRRWVGVVLWWRVKDQRHGLWWRAANLLAAVLIIVTAILPVAEQLVQSDHYKLSAAAIKLAGKTDTSLSSQLKYDAEKKTYTFNQDSVETDDVPSKLQKASVGAENKSNTKTYALEVPEDITKGVTYHDTDSQLSFSLVPEFKGMSGKTVDGHIVFPLYGGNQAVYTLKNNGLKEDIVVPKVTESTMQFDYQLKLPKTLEAKVIEGSGGAIGVYSADPVLYNNMSYGSDADRAAIEKVRQKSTKNHLVFGLPAPVIVASDGGSIGQASARFALNGSRLSVIAEGLGGITRPISIDPSVVVTSTSDFETGGNNEGNIDFATSGQITRGKMMGGELSAAWSTAAADHVSVSSVYSTNGTDRYSTSMVAYNNHLYLVGGINGVTDVDIATINSDGTLGAWTNYTTSLPRATIYPGIAAYNGYLYMFGGNSGTIARDNVDYAPINSSDGTLGSWTATTPMNTGVCRHGYAVYNGYLYATGGNSGTVSSNCANTSTPTNLVQYAPINPNGSVGTWNTTSSFTTARMSPATVAHNGYIYVVGGTTNGSVQTEDAQYAALNADGSISAWTMTNFLGLDTSGHYRHGLAVYNGYLYLQGGCGGSSCGDVYYTQINANGSLGLWQTDAHASAQTGWGFGFVAYKGYLYRVGGSNLTPTPESYAEYAPITATPGYPNPSLTQGLNPVKTFTTGRRGLQSVAYNNYLYVMGGDGGTVAFNGVQLAQIGPDGTLGAFSTTTFFTTNRTFFGAFAYNGYMYVLGGCTPTAGLGDCTNAANNTASVYSAAINMTDGTIAAGSWNAQTSFTTARYGFQAVQFGGYVYVMGGLNGSTFKNDVQYATLGASGAITSWTTASSNTIPTARAGFAAAVYNGYVYVAGGCSAGNLLTCTTRQSDVQYAQLSPSGGFSANWASTSSFTNARYGQGLAVSNGYMYLTAGYNGTTYYSDTQYTSVNSDGTLNSWAAGKGLTVATWGWGVSATSYNGVMYVSGGVGGTGTTYRNQIHYVTLNNGGGGGTAAAWTTGTSFANARESLSSVAYKGYLYVLGGFDGTSTRYNDVQYAPVNPDGSLGAWHYTHDSTDDGTSFVAGFFNARSTASVVVYNDYMYILGGTDGTTRYNDVQYAHINADGTVGVWHYTHDSTDDGTSFVAGFTSARSSAAAAVYKGYLYISGGVTPTVLSNVQYAPINTNGTVGAWANTTSLPVGLYGHGFQPYSGKMYLISGSDSGATVHKEVKYVTINGDGSLSGTWIDTTPLDSGRNYAQAIISNGFVYVTGGTDGTAQFKDVQYAPINGDGTIGNWNSTALFTGGRYQHGAAVANGMLYIFGGYSSGSRLATSQYAPLKVYARTARYSKMITFSDPVNIQSITYNGLFPTGPSGITYKAGDASGTNYVSSGYASTASGIGGCTGTTNYTKYLFITVFLDDSQPTGSAVFPDSASAFSNLTDITVNYYPTHPAPNIRLRGGKTLQNSVLTPLDTCI